MFDDVLGALIGGMVGAGIQEGIIRGRAKRKAKRYLAGEAIRVRAHLRRDGADRPRRGRLAVSPGTEVASWTPWPRWSRSPVELLLVGGAGVQTEFSWGFLNWGVPGHSWPVRVGNDEIAELLLERSYLAAFAPILSLGSVPVAKSHRRRK